MKPKIEKVRKRVCPLGFSLGTPGANTKKAKSPQQDEAEPVSMKRSKEDEAISLLSDSENDGGKSTGIINLIDGDDFVDTDEVIIVDPPSTSAAAGSKGGVATGITYFASAENVRSDDEDDEVQAIGEKNAMKLPHLRQHCVEYKFVQDVRSKVIGCMFPSSKIMEEVEDGKKCNPKTCERCYCYICDKPARDCKQWASDTFDKEDHCHASDEGASASHYKSLRDASKQGRVLPKHATVCEISHGSNNASANTSSSRSARPADETLMGRGPWEPSHPTAGNIASLTKCRRCGWYNKFSHRNGGRGQRKTHPSDCDWCKACGRVACTRDFEKIYHSTSVSKLGHVSLGTKTIPFRIKGRDPRKMESVAQRWRELEGKSEGWKYDKAQMEEDFFLHRIGKNPTLDMILRALPIVSEDKIPDSSDLKDWNFEPLRSHIYSISFTECEAILLDDPEHLQLLWHMQSCSHGYFEYSLKATWYPEKRMGMLNVSLDLVEKSFDMKAKDSSNRSFPNLLGVWFDVPRFNLSELTRGLRAEPSSVEYKEQCLGVRSIDKAKADKLISDWASVEKDMIQNYNDEAKIVSNHLSFQSSARADGCGGTVDSDLSFKGTLKRFAAESIFDDLILKKSYGSNRSDEVMFGRGRTPVATDMAINSAHRGICHNSQDQSTLFPADELTSYLDKDDQSIARTLKDKVKHSRQRCATMNGLMQELENLGHKPIEHVEGLNVELFDFQREAVGWALERECTEGGLESFLWTKIPGQFLESVSANGKKRKSVDLYYSPILDLFKKTKPADVRGGLIATQMGLGKTVISLSLILMNPAPAIPASGSASDQAIPSRPAQNEALYVPNWPTSGGDKPPEASIRHGSILSHGTLVVCNVSLVGQWIDEARSKLKDPGLVYSYHGSSRKRCPNILAQNSIVVTTYATIASDAYHHKKKSADPDYCAPCESIKWWRIICDESHTIRDVNTKGYKALIRLSAANKWCVTGTPMNTSPKDLKGQLKFIGISDIGTMFTSFQRAMKTVFKVSRRNSRECDRIERFAPFLFLMRNVMIRHSIGQTGRHSSTSIMALPPKEETIIEIEYTKKERTEYNKIEQRGISLYESLKRKGNVNRHYLKLTSALLPLRLACSGGQLEEGQIKKKASGADETDTNTRPKSKKAKSVLDESDILFRSKFERLLKELENIRDNEPSAKSLVFSQFTSTLKWMQQELPKHGFQFRTLSGDMPMSKRAKALRDFQSDPPTTIFLLSLRSGAVGINLTQANRVFLMEPAMNPALEAQAVGRVYRLGQRKSVKIIRMQMKDSFESRLVGVLKKRYGDATKPNPEAASASASASGAEKEVEAQSLSSTKSEGKKKEDGEVKEEAPEVQFVTSADTATLGHMKSDKPTLITEEFDALFGVTRNAEPDEVANTGDGQGPAEETNDTSSFFENGDLDALCVAEQAERDRNGNGDGDGDGDDNMDGDGDHGDGGDDDDNMDDASM